MISYESFALLRPYWLLSLPALWIYLKVTQSLDSSLGDWPRVIDPPILGALLGRRRQNPRMSSDTTISWCVIIIILSLCGPATRVAVSSQFRNIDAALIVMNTPVGASLPKITSAAQIVLKECGARQTGLLLYAGDAYLASPLTYDLDSIGALLFSVDDQTIPDGGVRPDRALELAHDILRRTNIYAGDVVLIGDGAGVTPKAMEAAKALAADGHHLHTIFVASSAMNNIALSSPQTAMQQLASNGHGINGELNTARNIAEAISARSIEHVTRGSRVALEWFDLGRLLIILAVLPLLKYFYTEAL